MKLTCYNTRLVIIGGSAGSMPVIFELISSLPKTFDIPLVIVIHRQKNSDSEMPKIFAAATGHKKICEPEDKEPVRPGYIYIAPQNYHLLIEKDYSFSLDYSETIMYSRPSIDVTLESAAGVYKDKLLGILLSGANTDGTAGLKKIQEAGGWCIAQEPATAQYAAMPASAIAHVPDIMVADIASISSILKEVNFQ